ncbi:hypothetical protein ABBQ38_012864 [Trebouxia sp. C0009 RCD-2024]
MDLRIGAAISGMWGLFRSVCDKLEGQRPIIEGAMDSNAGGVVAGSVHQLMQSDQVILVSAGCLDSNAGGVVAGSVHQLMQSDQVILVSAGCLSELQCGDQLLLERSASVSKLAGGT